jgi:addiction module HigA family antidote
MRVDYVVHPGELLHDELTERKMLQADLSRATGYTQKHICRVVRGNAGIGVAFAVALERELGISALLWLRMQAAHDLFIYRTTGRGR